MVRHYPVRGSFSWLGSLRGCLSEFLNVSNRTSKIPDLLGTARIRPDRGSFHTALDEDRANSSTL